ncbi:unnamed protein product [Ostreobium quekettii]|uniref:EF-hand domain-containing protein n=1 Tax=Ostreobium quekettii TaxID=121088 RepID=A0A8S1J8U1_9CHLO|nr:unnamed protein product [Ostreobium quekettii]|eukprot:evm.model.scf_700.1 EVM.evm.TU.scf_700.1   scf_700:22509-23663(+)
MATDGNDFEDERRRRITRNRQMLSHLGVTKMAGELVQAGRQEIDRKRRRLVEPVGSCGPARRSTRHLAQVTREKIKKMADRASDSGDGESASGSSGESGGSGSESDEGDEEEYDPLEGEGGSESDVGYRGGLRRGRSRGRVAGEDSAEDDGFWTDEERDLEVAIRRSIEDARRETGAPTGVGGGDREVRMDCDDGGWRRTRRERKLPQEGGLDGEGRQGAPGGPVGPSTCGEEGIAGNDAEGGKSNGGRERKRGKKMKEDGGDGGEGAPRAQQGRGGKAGGKRQGGRKTGGGRGLRAALQEWPEPTAPAVAEAFGMFDKRGSGLLTREALVTVASDLGMHLGEDAVEGMMDLAKGVAGSGGAGLTLSDFQVLVAHLGRKQKGAK